MPYWRLHYHLIWTTYERVPMLDNSTETIVHDALHRKARTLGILVHAVGNNEDHIHVIVSIPPTMSVADCVRHLKGASAYTVNHMPGERPAFKWQEGYGAVTISERSLPSVIAYVNNQKQHHHEGTVIGIYEHTESEANATGSPGDRIVR